MCWTEVTYQNTLHKTRGLLSKENMLMNVIFLLVFIRSVELVDISLNLMRTDFPFSLPILLLSFEWINCWTDVNWKQKQGKCHSAAKGISVVKVIHTSVNSHSWKIAGSASFLNL